MKFIYKPLHDYNYPLILLVTAIWTNILRLNYQYRALYGLYVGSFMSVLQVFILKAWKGPIR